MRLLAVCAAAVTIALASAAHAQVPEKRVLLYNNSNIRIYPIIEIGKKEVDEWLQARFQVLDVKKQTYSSSQVYRIYVGEDQGIAPRQSAEVVLPLYSQLAAVPDGAKPNQYADWWNGGRIYFNDIAEETEKSYQEDSKHPVTPIAGATRPCEVLQGCQPLNIFASDGGLPATDHSQLTEYSFADAITANGPPYAFNLEQVGYNISSVDQVYLPVAMEVHGNPLVPYIGTVIPVFSFRDHLRQFFQTAFPGWPVYLPKAPGKPRIPGAYVVFANGGSDLLTKPGATIAGMRELYRTCNGTSAPQDLVCQTYQTVVAMFEANYKKYRKLACSDPTIVDSEDELLKKIYGWVPFNEKCGPGVNRLADTYDSIPRFTEIEHAYIRNLQYSQQTPLFNPYVSLIHDKDYLDMAAYAFSVDDAIGFQSYRGDGLILAVGGETGLINTNKLDKADRVIVSLGSEGPDKKIWEEVGLCSNAADTAPVKPSFPSFEFYPPKYPCRFTVTAVNKRTYQLEIAKGPPDLTVTCPANLTSPEWCKRVQLDGAHNINTIVPN